MPVVIGDVEVVEPGPAGQDTAPAAPAAPAAAPALDAETLAALAARLAEQQLRLWSH